MVQIGVSVSRETAPAKKQFKCRVERPAGDWHAMEIWLQARNIVDAARDVMDVLSPLGITTDQISKLIELESHE